MPYKRNYRRRAPARRALRRKIYRRRKHRRNDATTMRLKPGLAKGVLVPDRYFLKMRFTYVNNSWTETSGVKGLAFVGNSIYQPDGSSSAQGSTAMSNLYSKYRVHGSKIVVRFANSDSTNQVLVCVPSPSDITADSAQTCLDQSYSKFKQVGPLTGQGRASIGHYMTTKRILGYKSIFNEEDVIASLGAQPTKQWYWNVITFNANNASTTGGQMYVEITYFVELYQRVAISSQT